MDHPQTYAIKLAENIETIKKFSCCVNVVLWWAGIDCSDAEAINIINDAIEYNKRLSENKLFLDDELTVVWKPFIQWLTGRSVNIEFRDITSLKGIKKRTPVKFKNGSSEHWAGVENEKVVFDPKLNSNTIKEGKPVSARIITLA